MEKATATFIILSIFMALFLIVAIGKEHGLFTPSNTYYVYFNTGEGLSKGTKVVYLGIDIGRVVDIELTPEDRVKVELEILKKYSTRIRASSVARRSTSLLGGSSIEIITIDKDSEPLSDGDEIFSSDTFQGRLLVEKAVEKGLISGVDIMKKVSDTLDSLQSLTPSISRSLRNLADIMENVNAATRPLKRIAVSAERESSIGKIVKDQGVLFNSIQRSLNSIENVMASMKVLAANLKTASGDFKKISVLIEQNLVETRQLLKSLQNMVGRQEEGKRRKIIGVEGRAD